MAVQLGQHALVVLDDLPQLPGRDGLSVRLQQLVRAFRSQGVRLLSLSAHELPSVLRRSLHQQVLHTWAIELFSQSEAVELLQSYEAPESVVARARFINTLAMRHPPFIEAITQYLEQHNWQFDEQILSELFQQKYAADIREETQSRLLATVEDGHTRDLLYRLAIILGNFSFDAVRILAEVDPVIDHPRERLITLTGPWIERERPEYYRLSPLIRSVGTDDLSRQTKRDCNRVLAEQILSTERLHIAQALSILNYLLNAEEYNRAGLFTISVLLDIQRQVQSVEDYGFISLWAKDPLPAQMDLGIRLYLRGLQFDLQSARGYDTAYLERDMKALLAQTTANETWAILAAWAAARGRVQGIHLALLSVLRYWSQALLPNGKPLASVFPEDMHPESLIWVSASEVETSDQLRDWIEAVEQLTEDQRRYTFNEPYAEAGCTHIVDSVWHKEAKKPKEQQDWVGLLAALDNLVSRALSLQLELLWACAIRAQIMVMAEYDQDLTGALAKAEDALLQASNDPRAQFLLRECVGRQLLDAHREQEAGNWLQQALDELTPAYPYEHMVALLCLSRALGPDDPQQAAVYTEEAVKLAEMSPAIGDIALVKALGEDAIALWMVDERERAFDSWDRAADVLLACRSESDEWKGLFVLFGHLSGYFTSMTQTGQPPAETSSGEPYEPPKRGLFFTNHSIRAHLYDQARDSFLMVLLTQFAEAVGRDERTAVWAQKGIELSREEGRAVAYYQVSADMIPYLVLEHRYAEALDIALEAGMISVALREQHKRGGDVLERDLEITELLGARPSEAWQHAEYQAAQIALLPAMFSLGLIAMDNPDQARKQAEEIVALCRDISSTASDQTLWETAAQLIEQTFVTTKSVSEWRKTLDSLPPNEYDVLRALAYLGASLQPGFSLDDACQLHAITLAYMEKAVYQAQSTGYRRLVSPFFTTYWLTKFAQQRFRFRMPATIDAELQDARRMPESRRARTVLWTVASGLGINLGESGLQAP
jgi:muconolactone delta-isomerase